jgi:hypothetical protein
MHGAELVNSDHESQGAQGLRAKLRMGHSLGQVALETYVYFTPQLIFYQLGPFFFFFFICK